MRTKIAEMRTKIVAMTLVVASLLLVTGCKEQAATDDSGNKQIQMKESTYPDEILNEADAAVISDVIDDQYAEPLEIRLSDDELGELVEMIRGSKMKAGSEGTKPYYKIVIKSSSDDVLDEWTVDFERNVTTKFGTPDDTDNMSDWLRSMESRHAITYESVLERRPGGHYFDDIGALDRGQLTEITDNNFVEGVEYKLDKEDLESVGKALAVASIGDSKESDAGIMAHIYLYDSNGAEIHTLDVTGDGKVYCNSWPVKGEELSDCIRKIEEKSGL